MTGWLSKNADGDWVSHPPFWDEDRFFKLLEVPNHRPATAFITVNGKIRAPDFTVRHETFERDVAGCIAFLGVAAEYEKVPKRNSSSVPLALKTEVLQKSDIRDRVEDIYRADMDFFGFESFQA